jgi:hypothetical protein
MRRFMGECAHFIFNKCPIYTHDGASAKFSTNSQETDNSVIVFIFLCYTRREKPLVDEIIIFETEGHIYYA